MEAMMGKRERERQEGDDGSKEGQRAIWRVGRKLSSDLGEAYQVDQWIRQAMSIDHLSRMFPGLYPFCGEGEGRGRWYEKED